jgi:hypothetical protein
MGGLCPMIDATHRIAGQGAESSGSGRWNGGLVRGVAAEEVLREIGTPWPTRDVVAGAPKITFIEQAAPVDEYGRALYAIGRSILRALRDSLSAQDLTDVNTPSDLLRMRQLSKVVRLDRDKGMRGDGFEWAVHEAIMGGENKVLSPVHEAMTRASTFVVRDSSPTSILFGHERAKYLGFLDAVVDDAGTDAVLLPSGSGRPFKFDTWVAVAARGAAAEPYLKPRIKQVWKTDLFLSAEGDEKHFAATVKSNFDLLEGGRGLRIGIVPESARGNRAGVRYSHKHGLWVVSLADPNGFMGLFNDAYNAVGRAICALGKQEPPSYWVKPSAKAQRVQSQIEKFPDALVVDIEGGLNEAAQQDLVKTEEKLVSVNAPDWLRMKEMAPKVIAPKPKFTKLD